ncbi:MAG: hypothetical protein J6I66_03910 [Lachnospiraceae bacterium]|nr:hypothetical protein [Lachnospiraceae bacterium]
MKTIPESEDKSNPALWINRAKNGYPREKKTLMITAAYKPLEKTYSGGYVTDNRNGITLTLSRLIYESGEKLAVPVSREEAISWNVPIKIIIGEALDNTPKLFPVSVFDVRKNRYIDIPFHSYVEYDFDTDPMSSVAAESGDFYDSAESSGLRFILSCDKITGCAVIFYPGLMHEIARMLAKNPTILICEPGKVFVFESGKRKKKIRDYIERYRNYIGDMSYDPYLFRYIKENNVFLELGKDAELRRNPVSEARIPQGSIASAWGDADSRRKLLEWKRGINH